MAYARFLRGQVEYRYLALTPSGPCRRVSGRHGDLYDRSRPVWGTSADFRLHLAIDFVKTMLQAYEESIFGRQRIARVTRLCFE
jgi:hypothetical protein